MSKIFFAPHPPIIIPEIGMGREYEAKSTIEGMKKVASMVKEIKPETIICITPHGNAFRNGTCLLAAEEISGDLRQFGNSDIEIIKSMDTDLISIINELWEEEDFIHILMDDKTSESYGVKVAIDHGVLVPLYYIDKEYSDYKIVHITPGFTSLEENYKLGISINKAIESTGKNVVVLASGDLSHALKDEGPYKYNPLGEQFDTSIVDSIKNIDIISILTMDEKIYEEAAQCGLRSFLMALGVTDGKEIKSEVYSYEGPFGVGYMTGYIYSEDKKTASLLDELDIINKRRYIDLINKEDDYIKLARNVINYYVKHKKKPSLEDLDISEEFLEKTIKLKAGTFVSIHKNNALRGCIGTISPVYNNVVEEIINNAISASTQDPRFNPIEEKELKKLDIKVDILSEAKLINSISELDPKKYGVIVEQGNKRGLLLPNLEGIDTVKKQLKIAKDKAGITTDDNIKIYVFMVERHEVN